MLVGFATGAAGGGGRRAQVQLDEARTQHLESPNRESARSVLGVGLDDDARLLGLAGPGADDVDVDRDRDRVTHDLDHRIGALRAGQLLPPAFPVARDRAARIREVGHGDLEPGGQQFPVKSEQGFSQGGRRMDGPREDDGGRLRGRQPEADHRGQDQDLKSPHGPRDKVCAAAA